MNIFWILEDAVRPSHMGCYGYHKNTTPNCDRLAREGVRFETVISTASHTVPPILSMIMGQTTGRHGVTNCPRFAKWRFENPWKDVRTPLNILAENGYLIDGELVMRWKPLGFTRDTPFDEIEDYFEENRDKTWFFYAEPYPTHLPYNPPDDYFKMFLDDGYTQSDGTLERMKAVRSFLIIHPAGLISNLEAGAKDVLPDEGLDESHRRTATTVDFLPEDKPAIHALYDGEMRVFDDLVGRWIDKLEGLGILDDTLFILTSDHGEELMDRGHVGHSSCNLSGTLYDESIKVPLIMRYPKKLPAGMVVKQQVSHIDIMPTIFDMIGLAIPDWMEGRSTMPLISGAEETFREEVYTETSPAGWQSLESDHREIFCVRTADWKLILNTDTSRKLKEFELYNLRKDPLEKDNCLDRQTDVAPKLKAKLEAYLRVRQKSILRWE
ncbi:MAG TPA: DUF4976 domain-containing protein [Phycisphaerae bacterium]|nr:DUF4976 domain-containing protein [Phycisphaerae bacterium]